MDNERIFEAMYKACRATGWKVSFERMDNRVEVTDYIWDEAHDEIIHVDAVTHSDTFEMGWKQTVKNVSKNAYEHANITQKEAFELLTKMFGHYSVNFAEILEQEG